MGASGKDPALDAYRNARRLPDEARTHLWQRIQSSVHAGEVGPRLAPEPERIHRRAWATAAVLCAAAIAALAVIDGRVLQRAKAPPAQEAAQISETPEPSKAHPGKRSVLHTPAQKDTGTPEAEPPEPPAPPTTQRPRHQPPSSTTLAAELAMLKAAEGALERGHARDALTILERHEKQYPTGQLQEDRMALRIRVLCALDKKPQARGETRLFLRQFPNSPHTQKIRSACPDTNP